MHACFSLTHVKIVAVLVLGRAVFTTMFMVVETVQPNFKQLLWTDRKMGVIHILCSSHTCNCGSICSVSLIIVYCEC